MHAKQPRKRGGRSPVQLPAHGVLLPAAPRTDPVVQNDDVVILRTGGSTSGHAIYQVHVGIAGPLPELFTVFERAAVKGDEVARTKNVALFYLDSPHDPPFLVHDYRK